jgi:hypothetical protein
MQSGNRFAVPTGVPAVAAGPEPGAIVVRKGLASWGVLAIVAAVATFAMGVTVGQANDRDETVMTVQVSSADHEILEGYFTLGDNATVMVKPGSDLYKFLSRQRGRKVKITLSEAGTPELSRLQR